MEDNINTYIALTFIPMGTALFVRTYRNRVDLKRRSEGDHLSKGMDIYQHYLTSFSILIVGFFYLFIILFKHETNNTPLFLGLIYFLGALYILMFRPSFSYSTEEKESMQNYGSFDDQNKLFLLIIGIVSLSFSIVLFLITGLKYIQ